MVYDLDGYRYVEVSYFPICPVEDGQGVGFGVEHPLVERNELFVRKEQVQVFQSKQEVDGEQARYRGTLCVTYVSAMKKLGISFFFDAGDSSTDRTLAYPLAVLHSRSIASKTAHPRSLHISSPVVLHNR